MTPPRHFDALVYHVGPEKEDMNIAYPNAVFDCNPKDSHAVIRSVLSLTIGSNSGSDEVENFKVRDVYFLPAYLRLFDGPSFSIADMWRILSRGPCAVGCTVGSVIKAKPTGTSDCHSQGGDFDKLDPPQKAHVRCQMCECILSQFSSLFASIQNGLLA